MSTAARSQAPDAAWTRLLEKLANTRLERDGGVVRIGAGVADVTDPRLLELVPAGLRPAAVLIGLIDNDPEPGILLTVRADHLRHHAGQIAFPGGTIDSTDAGPMAAALREAREEVGLSIAETDVLGYLQDQVVLTGYRITPVVARIPGPFVPRLDSAEVQSCFVLPFSTLLDPVNERAVTRSIGGIEVAVRDLHFGEHHIWGATAGMLFALRALAVS